LLASRRNKEGHSTWVAVERGREIANTINGTIVPFCLQPQEPQLTAVGYHKELWRVWRLP